MMYLEISGLSWRKSSRSAENGTCVEVSAIPATAWRKSSYSGDNGTCVEVAAVPANAWRKSSHSGGNGTCVEVAFPEGAVAARDSKDPEGAVLVFGRSEWSRFATAMAHGAFDRR